MSAPSKSIIEDLLEKPFITRSCSEKQLIIEKGRPCPKLSNLKSVHKDSKKEYTRSFKESQYSLYPWLAGCENTLKLFCWPCLLFSQVNSAWTSTGVDNMNTLQTLQKNHKNSVSHLQCLVKLAHFGENKRKDDEDLSAELRELNSQHNMDVKRNREILIRLIDVTCFLVNQELPFTEHDESDSSNQGNYVELLNFLALYDSKLMEPSQTGTVFDINSISIRNDLIKAVGELLNSHISKQLENSEFVAIILDEPSDVQTESQLSVVFRYCVKGKTHETFVGFIDISSARSADDLFKLVEALLQKYNVVQKLVAQSYAGESIRNHVKDLQIKVKDLCLKSPVVHCYAHDLYLVLTHGLSNFRECSIFFGTMNGIATFTSNPCIKTTLKEYLEQKIPSLAATKWCFGSRLVNVVQQHRDLILEYFESIENYIGTWDCEYIYSTLSENVDTIFMLNVFSKLFKFSDKLFDTFQNKNIDIFSCVIQMKKCNDFLKELREGFSEVWQCTLSQAPEDYIEVGNDKIGSDEIKYKKLFYEIIDNLIMQISEKMSSFQKLEFFELLNGRNFSEYAQKNKFPDKIMETLIDTYPDIFDRNQLKSQLTVIYLSREDIRDHLISLSMKGAATAISTTESITAYDIMLYIGSQIILEETFDQVYKLSKLICTIPASTVAVESEGRTFSALKRIKTYLKNTQRQERQNLSTFLSIEKEMLAELRNCDNFYDQVIENFLSFEQRVEFMYK